MTKVNRKDSKGRVLRTGEDEIIEKGCYRYRYTDRYKKRKTIYASTLAELRKQEKQIQKDLEENIDTDAATKSLYEHAQKFLKTKTKLSVSTYEDYRYSIEHHIKNSSLGIMPIHTIRKSDVLTYYAELSKNGMKNRSIEYIHRIIFSVLELAVEDDIIRKNPSKNCSRDYCKSEKERVALTKEQQKIFMDYVQKSSFYKRHIQLITFLLGTGCRIGEALGLTWDDIDFQNGWIHIRKQLRYKSINGKMMFYISVPKTKAGIRDIPMSNDVRKQLMSQKQAKYFLSKSSGCKIDGYKDFVFVNTKGYVLKDVSFYHVLERISKGILEEGNDDFPKVSAHILRHTFCTRMAEQGVDMKTLQTLMGHEDSKMIMKVYDHVQNDRLAAQVEKMNNVINL